MFYSFPRADISKIILNVLTKLACKSLTNIHETITFFIKLLHEEPREKIHLALLKNLYILANKVSHLWTRQNLASFIEYVSDQQENNLLMLKSSEILVTLAKNSNIYFLFAFSTSSELDEDKHLFQNLIEAMIFHENQEIAFNFCQLSTILLVLQKKNLTNGIENNNSDFKAAKSDTENINKLFELTKNGLFSIILDSDNAIEALSNSNHHETATLSAPKLEIYTKFLKVYFYN